MIFTYNQLLFDINQNDITETIMGPNLAGRETEYKFSIQKAGDPIDLSLLQSLRKFYETGNDENINSNNIHSIKQVLSIALHEHCSTRADFIYNRTFYLHPSLGDTHDSWDLGLGKAVWRGFYSALTFSKGHHQLLMNLDGKYLKISVSYY